LLALGKTGGSPIPLVLALILNCLLVTVVPLAHACVTDPLWISGMYDGGDQDEAVTLLMSHARFFVPRATLRACGRRCPRSHRCRPDPYVTAVSRRCRDERPRTVIALERVAVS